MNWFIDVIKKYAVFTGRARRKEYWMYMLFWIIGYVILAVLESLVGLTGVLTSIYALGLFLPGLGVAIRRLHDTGKTGWWILIALVPLIGAIVLLIFMIQDGTPGDNAHGPNPKA